MEQNGKDASSSDVSDADPAEILNSLKNIDDLDAELFGPKKTTPVGKKETKPSVVIKEKKKVSFQDPVDLSEGKDQRRSKSKPLTKTKKDDFDFDLDDPLAGLLSDEDDTPSPGSSPTANRPAGRKESSADDWLFADDDADDLLDDSPVKIKDKSKVEESNAKRSVESLMKRTSTDDLLKKSSPSIKKMTLDEFASNAAKLSPDKLASPYTASPSPAASREIKFNDEFGFGSYQPSLSSPADNKRKGRSRRPQTDSTEFFDFLNDEDGLKSPQQEKVLSPIPTKETPAPHHLGSPVRPATAGVTMSPKPDFKTQDERPRSSDSARIPPALSPLSAPQAKQVIYDKPLITSSQEKKRPVVDAFVTTPKIPPPVSIQPPRPSRRSLESPFITSLSPFPDEARATNAPSIQPHVPQTHETKIVSNGEEARSQSLDAQLAHTRALLHNTELGYKADLEVMKTTYDSRIELLKSSFEDLKSRVDRELDSVRESYSARIGVLRNAMQSQIQADTSKECEHQEEVKRLRNLHLQALDECRVDGDSQIARLKEGHAAEIEAIRNSTYHARNIESMMSKVEESTERLQQLSSKYESAYRAMTQQSETIALSNKQLISVVQNQLSQQQRSTLEAQIQMQQTASRLEGSVSEMNRKMEEQHYAMQLSHSNLQSAHAALQEERKQFMQQITLEREHLRKAHREMINLQNEIRQETREDRAKLLRASDELSSIATRYEEAKITEAEQASRRNRDHEEAMNDLNTEKMEFAKKKAHLEAASEKINSQRQDLHTKLTQFNEEKQILQQIQLELEQREADLNTLTQKAMDSEADKERVFSEAKRLEEDQSKKLVEIHNEMKELTKQRQLLAEERRALAQERSSAGLGVPISPSLAPPIPQVVPSSSTVTPIKQRLMMAHPGSPGQPTGGAGLALWQHSVKKDQNFLEDEQFFLETLKNSPYRKK